MQGRKCESLSNKPGFLVRCGCLFDEKTRARLERENEETWKGKFYDLLPLKIQYYTFAFILLLGLLSLKERRRIRKKEELVLQREDEHKEGKVRWFGNIFLQNIAIFLIYSKQEAREDETRLVEKSRKDYKFTKWSKLKILRQKEENKKWQEYLKRHKNWIFCAALIKLKVKRLLNNGKELHFNLDVFQVSLSRQEWHRTCHLKERTIIRKNIHLENILKYSTIVRDIIIKRYSVKFHFFSQNKMEI